MLESLTIQNLATIEELTIQFGPGLNALTGETGAGKSILIEGLGLALGERASAESIRSGAALASVEAAFAPPLPRALAAILNAELGLDWNPEEGLHLRREISRGGKNRCLIDGQMVGVGDLARIGELLVDFHGQHDRESLLRKGAAREALDAFAGNEALIAAHAAAWNELSRLAARRDELELAARDFAQRADYLDFQLEELDRIAPRPGEQAELERDEDRLARADTLAQSAAHAYALIYEGPSDELPAILASLREVQRSIAELAIVEPAFADAPAKLEEAKAALEDLAGELRNFAERSHDDPERLNAIIERGEAIRHLIRKHGGSEDSLAVAWRAMRIERDRMALDNEERKKIAGQMADAEKKQAAAAAKLHESRAAAAERFAKAVLASLKQLGMEKAKFEVALEPLAEPQSHGGDDIDFLLAANPGLPPAPLRKVGSGGELSRVMLALKSALAARDRIPTLVFDEIDAGVSGQTALRVAGMLEKLGQSHQILCITHQAPIAARAGRHASVRKAIRGDATYTQVVPLGDDARLEELARMMGGNGDGTTARKLARELMQ